MSVVFGDDWQHVLVHEGLESADDSPSQARRVDPPVGIGGDADGHQASLRRVEQPELVKVVVEAAHRILAMRSSNVMR